jgi:hypothetical protein
MYATPSEQGIAKTPRPPFVKPFEPKKAEPQKKRDWMGWFPLEPKQLKTFLKSEPQRGGKSHPTDGRRNDQELKWNS